MSFLSDDEKDTLSIKRMIFHVVGKSLEEPILLKEISPPQHQDFFLERVKSSLRGNLFGFRDHSPTEEVLRQISQGGDFTELTQKLALDFQSRHKTAMSVGVFFIFEMEAADATTIYALVKYDNEDVVRYVLDEAAGASVPKLERFQESFVRKPEAMQKIALVRLDAEAGGKIMVRDRSNTAHISDYFEGFLRARRVNEPSDMTEKLANALKDTFKEHRNSLPDEVKRSGVNRIYEALKQGPRFDPDDCEPLLGAIFGPLAEDAPLRKTLRRRLRDQGVSEETFDVSPERVQKPRRHVIETAEGVQVIYDAGKRPEVNERADGRQEIVIVTARVTRDDAEIEASPRRG